MAGQEPNILIDTPENVFLQAETAGFGSRSLAAFVDYLIVFVLIIVFVLLFSLSITSDLTGRWLTAVYVLVLFCLFMFYHLFFELIWNGQTPGKRLLKIRVVQYNGMPLTVSGLLIRNLVRLFDFLPFFYGVGLLAMFATKHTQRLGDLAARTIVIREHPQVTLRTVRENLSVHYVFLHSDLDVPPDIDISSLTERDRRTIVNYLQRRSNLQGRETLAVPLAKRISAALNPTEIYKFYDLNEAEKFLEQVARAFEISERRQSLSPEQFPRQNREL